LIGVGASIAQAISIVVIKPYMGDWPLFWMTSWRMAGGLLASVLILPLLPTRSRNLSSLADRSTWIHMIPGILLGTFLSLLFWMGGFKYADASTAAALNQMSTLFTFVLAIVILREPVTKRGLAGLTLGFLGALLVTVSRAT
jgi:drug/metabolite transporter (DMT)-like permease